MCLIPLRNYGVMDLHSKHNLVAPIGVFVVVPDHALVHSVAFFPVNMMKWRHID